MHGGAALGKPATSAKAAQVQNGPIVFDRAGTTRGTIYSIGSNGGRPRAILRNALEPSESLHKRELVFQGEGRHGYASGYSIAVAKPTGTGRMSVYSP